MNRFFQLLICCFCFLIFPLSAAEDVPDSQDLINSMSMANRNLNYEGTFVFSRGKSMDTMHILHKSDGNGEVEKIVSLTGFAREIIRNNETVTCIYHDTQMVVVERSNSNNFVTILPDPIEKIADYYAFATMGDDRVAGHDAWVVKISPKDGFRYGYQLWIDKDSKLLLKSELRDNAGVSIEQVMFTQLTVQDSIAEDLFKPSISGKDYTWHHYFQETEQSVKKVSKKWKVSWMPAGFTMSNYEQRAIADDNSTVEHLIYSDGVAIISIFIEKLGRKARPVIGPLHMGGVNAYAIIDNNYQVTAVGEVPQATVQRMVNSVVGAQ